MGGEGGTRPLGKPQGRLGSAVVEVVEVLLRAPLHLWGGHPGWPADIGLPGTVLRMVEMVKVLLGSRPGLAGAPLSCGAAGEDLDPWYHLSAHLSLLRRLHGSCTQDAGRGEQNQAGKVSVPQGSKISLGG